MFFKFKKRAGRPCPTCRGRGYVTRREDVPFTALGAREKAEAMVLGGSVGVRETHVPCECAGGDHRGA